MPTFPIPLRDRFSDYALFGASDVTAGVENEWQACVLGSPGNIDLVQTILNPNHYRNLVARTRAGDVAAARLKALDAWLHKNPDDAWENRWGRLPLDRLHDETGSCLDQDLLADKRRPDGPRRADAERFFAGQGKETLLRIPVSYLLKLALVQATAGPDTPQEARETARGIRDCFLNDNTSPEICSFHPVPLFRDGIPGLSVARESLRRFLLTQLLCAYANTGMGLREHGQRVLVYAAPHPPLRQKQLAGLVSDAFYRELFMSPCLSGWNEGEAKYHYMRLCHEVLSRSQLNAVLRMREAGIIQNNLVATKIVEYFLPLFVGTFSAAPYKLDFMDFHPETLLGFLPHELGGTHLRMLWRRWKKKGRFKVFGCALTTFGPPWLDRLVNRLLRFKGDLVPDIRLLDYPVALLSTSRCPSLDGTPGNEQRLLDDLMDQGVFDHRMPVYRLWRLRDFRGKGFSGFEARFYSQFSDTLGDRWIRHLYGPVRKHAPTLFRLCTQARMRSLLGCLQYDLPGRFTGTKAMHRLAASMGIRLDECVDPPAFLTSARKLFERRIRYAETRPMTDEPGTVLSPADGRVLDFFEIDGCHHSCNPGAVIQAATPYAMNKRAVTILNTDVPGGTRVGKVAMIEVVALMIGRIEQCYSERHYEDPEPVEPGMFLRRGQPKSLYRPGSSTDILIFQPDRIRFPPDLVANRRRTDVQSRFSIAYGEGIGRLSCISFGCCYGRPVSTLPAGLQAWMNLIAFRFEGATRKAAYASGLEHVPLVPVQGFTNALYLAAGGAGLILFIAGRHVAAFLLALGVTQLWRILSDAFHVIGDRV